VFTERYALSPYIKQTRFVFKGLIIRCSLPVTLCYHLELCLCMTVCETSSYAQPNYTLFTLWIQHLCFVQAWLITQSILFSVVVSQCWRLEESRQPILVAKTDGLPTDCSGCGCSPASSTIFLISVSLKSLCESLEPQDCRRMWPHLFWRLASEVVWHSFTV
jgi:hypothetical protein